MQRLLILLLAALVVLALYTLQQSGQPDPNLINLAVRATVYARPSPSPQIVQQIVEVTRVVEVTRMVEVVRFVEVTATLVAPTAISVPTPAPTLTPTPLAAAPTAQAVALAAAVAPGAPTSSPTSVATDSSGCPTLSANQYTAIPVIGGRAVHPDSQHGDLNLALRGYAPAEATLSLIDINGPTDGDAPQLAGVLGHLPTFGRAFRARDWNWACGALGCRGELLGHVEVSLVALASTPGEKVFVASRGAEIYGGGYVALVLYADPARLTLVYTREDSVANGYAVHLEEFCVDPALLALYQSQNSAGRASLPAIRNGEAVGTAHYAHVVVGVRDRGTFTDPRSRKDWWRGY